MDRYVAVFVPLASDMVACVPGVVLCRYFSVAPDVTNEPTVLVVPAANFNVPRLNVNARLEPRVKASAQDNVPAPLLVTGKSIVLVLLVIVCVPLVALNDIALALAVSVMPEASVRLP